MAPASVSTVANFFMSTTSTTNISPVPWPATYAVRPSLEVTTSIGWSASFNSEVAPEVAIL